MSTEEQDLVVGRTLREYKEETHTLACLETKASAIACKLRSIADALDVNSKKNDLYGYVPSAEGRQLISCGNGNPIEFPNVDELHEILEEIYECRHRVKQLENEIVKMNISIRT